MRILITGATSFLGAETARAFLGAGHEVWAPVRPASQRTAFLPVHEGLHRVSADMADAAALLQMGLPAMDVCVHFAWSGVGVRGRMDPEIQEHNVRNTLEMLRTAKGLGCRGFLFAGSQAEYGVTAERVESGLFTGLPVAETEICRPISEYGKGKLAVLTQGSALGEQLGIRYVHMRIFSVYGEGDHGTSLVSSCVSAARERRTAELGPCRQQWNFLHVRDCAAAICALALKTAGNTSAVRAPQRTADQAVLLSSGLPDHVFNIGSGDTRPLKEYVQEVFDIAASCGYDGAGFLLQDRPAGPEGTPWLSPEIRKICGWTGWKPEISFRQGILEMLEQK